MSKDKLGGIVRALVGVPQERLVVVQKVVNGLNSNAKNGGIFQTDLSKFVLGWKPEDQMVESPLDLSTIPEPFHLSAKIYHKLFGEVPDFNGVEVPEAPDDGHEYLVCFNTLELIDWTDGKPKEGLFQAGKKLFPTWKYSDESLDALIPMDKDVRDLRKGSYVFLMRDSETPDEDLMNLSANQIAEMKNINPSTDTEYFIFSRMFFLKHGYHPDRQTWTLNAGSRLRDGGVPLGGWRGGGSRVNWCKPSIRASSLGSRRVWA